MLTKNKHVQKGKIGTSEDKRVQALLNVLNKEGPHRMDTVLREESFSLVKNLRILDELYRKSPKLFRQNKEKRIIDAYKQVNQLFSRYKVSLSILDSYQYGRPNPCGWEPTWNWADKPEQECAGMELFITALEIAQSGRIMLIGNCQNCQRLFFGRVSGQKFCSGKCRNGFHSTNEADKKRRADWAREKYKSSKNTGS